MPASNGGAGKRNSENIEGTIKCAWGIIAILSKEEILLNLFN